MSHKRLKCCHEMRFDSPKCVCGQGSAPDPAGSLQRSPDPVPGFLGRERTQRSGEGNGREWKEEELIGATWGKVASWRWGGWISMRDLLKFQLLTARENSCPMHSVFVPKFVTVLVICMQRFLVLAGGGRGVQSWRLLFLSANKQHQNTEQFESAQQMYKTPINKMLNSIWYHFSVIRRHQFWDQLTSRSTS